MRAKIVSVGWIGVATLFVQADEGLPPCPDDTPPCYKLVAMDTCQRENIQKDNTNCSGTNPRLALAWVDCPYTRSAKPDEAGREYSNQIVPNEKCYYKKGVANPGGGCTWYDEEIPWSKPVSCFSVSGGDCTGPNCNAVN